MIKIKKLAVVAACVLAGTLALVGCSQDVELDNGDTQDKDYPVVEAPKPLPLVVGYDKLTLHGKYRQYKVDTSKGDSLTEYSDGSPTGKYPIPAGAIKNGVEYPTFWSRLPLSIQPNNDDQTKGLYSIHRAGTSAIFPKSLDTSYKDREKDANVRQATAGVYIALSTTSPKIQFRYRYIMKTAAGTRAFSGIDIYQVTDGAPVFKQNLRGTAEEGIFEYETGASDTAAADLIVMLPTYNGFEVKEDDADNPSGLTLVFEEGSETYEIEPFNESTQKPILIYGTSITQGDGAGGLRPGAAYAAQIMWATGREVINLGVAGSAQMEYKMADFLSNIESSVFIMDPGWNLTSTNQTLTATSCTANGSPANITNKEIITRAKYMVTIYRAKHPNTPIIMCPQYLKSGDAKTKEWQDTWTDITKPAAFTNEEGYYYGRPGLLLYTAYLELKAEGVKNLYWAEQGVTGTAGDKYVSGGDLHPPINGMTDIANFILNCIDTNVPSVEVVTELPLSYLAQ